MMTKPPRVLVSYSHDSEVHKNRVLGLANRLRQEGVDCHLDQYESFPPEGWPRWMSRQIAAADFVFMVCTEIYSRRAEGHEAPGSGLGATWEGLLINQHIYDEGGRNSKFIPVIVDPADVRYIPAFVKPATRFNVALESDYLSLYRLITSQPAVTKPALGTLRSFPPHHPENEQEVDESQDVPVLCDVDEAVVVWRLPRGFLLLEDLQDHGGTDWATIASYSDYSAAWKQSTHFHESYDWWDRPGGMERQYAKLGIPIGDWEFARSPVIFMMDVRRGQYIVSTDGNVSGYPAGRLFDPSLATVHRAGRVPVPTMPSRYRPLVVSGALRDLVAEARKLLDDVRCPHNNEEVTGTRVADTVARIRREIRIELDRRLASDHPATANVEEIILTYEPHMRQDGLKWLKELADATSEAIQCIEEQSRI